ncbi:MAG: peptidylprolyl isomerase [Verrucomicrobia bacterium]|nr:peptidylprolyl isomerase [Verrucomicrobiota bacterium]MCH8527342.1 peptidylprolyl isomerase [Kiritimatiellia bacterium]
MRFFQYLILLSFLHVPALKAQIHADITLREGDSPLGTVRVLLHEDKAPRAVANFIGLAQGTRAWIDPANGAVREGVPFYNGLIFHRLIHNFMIQGGDPLGTGTGGPGYVFQDQFDPTLRHDGPYILSMAHSGPNSNGSQFFITLADTSFLDDLHTIFGTVINDNDFPDSLALIDSFTNPAEFPTDDDDRPLTDIIIDSITISGPGLASFDPHSPTHGLPQVSGPQMALRPQPDGRTFVAFNAGPKQDLPLYQSENLQTWFRPGNLLNMNPAGIQEVDVTPVVGPKQTFFTLPVVDYSHVPDLPQNIFAAGNQMILNAGGGVLTLSFNGTGGGNWQFEATAGDTTSGTLTYGFFENSIYPGIPTSGLYINSQGSWARALQAREIFVEFNTPVGPDEISNFRTVFSFHTETTGWYNGNINLNFDENTSGPNTRGTFTRIPPQP